MASYSLDYLPWRDVGNGWQLATVELKRGDTIPNVASTKRLIYGPATVEVWKAPGGLRQVVK